MNISKVGSNPYASHTGYVPTATVNGRTYGPSKTSNHDESSNKSKVEPTQSAQSAVTSKESGNSYANHTGYIPTVTVNGRTYGPGNTSNHDESTSKSKVQAAQSAQSATASKKSNNPYANHTGYIPYATVNGRTYGLGNTSNNLNVHL